MGAFIVKDKWQGLQEFWSSFDIPAYDEDTVPDDAEMPYITYSTSVASFENAVPLKASIWYRSTSWKDISRKAEEIAERLKSLYFIPIGENEYIMLAQGVPFAQRMRDEDGGIRRIYINVMAEYLTRH